MNMLNSSSLESRKALTQGTNFIISFVLPKLNGSTINRRQQVLLPHMKDWVKKCSSPKPSLDTSDLYLRG